MNLLGSYSDLVKPSLHPVSLQRLRNQVSEDEEDGVCFQRREDFPEEGNSVVFNGGERETGASLRQGSCRSGDAPGGNVLRSSILLMNCSNHMLTCT